MILDLRNRTANPESRIQNQESIRVGPTFSSGGTRKETCEGTMMGGSRPHVRPALHTLVASSAFVIAFGGLLVAAQSKEYLSVDDGRPLAEAIQMLEQR